MQSIAGGFIGDGKPATAAALVFPVAIGFDKSGNYYIADGNGNRVRKVSGGKISTLAGTGVTGYGGDGGPAASAQLSFPNGVAADSNGNVFIADSFNNVIRKVDASLNISTFATDPNFSSLGGLASDSSNNLYVADQGTCVVWKITPEGVVSLFAGTEFVCGYNGDNISATAAQLNQPFAVAVDTNGNVLIADYNNNRVRRVNRSGFITSITGDGTCGFTGDGGPAKSAEVCLPIGVAVTGGGTIYIADEQNERIRKITAGTINTYAGTGTTGFNGDGLPALSTNFDDPYAIAVDNLGAVYLVDDTEHRVRRIH